MVSAEKFPEEDGQRKNRPKIAKKTKNSTLANSKKKKQKKVAKKN